MSTTNRTERRTEVAVIGAGTAGLAAYRAAKAAGRRAVIIESGPHGTTCARVGCMPSKLLIAAAEAAHGVVRFPEFGLQLEGRVRVDGAAVMARLRRERDRFVSFVLDGVERIPAEDRIQGAARFLAPDRLAVDGGPIIHFERAVIATGSSPRVPEFLAGLGDRLLVNDDVFSWDTLPGAVAVFGTGVIGLELGQALHRLGVRVRLFGRGGIGAGLSDPEVRRYAERQFSDEYPVEFRLASAHARRVAEGVEITWTGADAAARRETFDYVLAATGRAANVQALGLELSGLALQPDGVPVFDRDTLQCGNAPIFIAGDANADVPLLHEAADEGRIAGANAAAWPDVQAGLRRSALAIVFSDPQLAVVGQRHADIPADRRVIGQASFEDQGRSRVMLRHRGLLRVYADRFSRRFLGAEMIAPEAEHLGHLLAWAHQGGMTIDGMLDMPFYHPVVEEGLRSALRDVALALDAASPAAPDDHTALPGWQPESRMAHLSHSSQHRSIPMSIHIGISDEGRKAVVETLRKLLADEFTLYVKTRNFHWNVVAPNFHDLHKFFEGQYESLDDTVDEIAERIRSLDAPAPGGLRDYQQLSRLADAPAGLDAAGMVAALLADHEALARTLRADIEVAEGANDPGTADFLTGLLEGHEKTAWMLRATRQA